MYDRVQIVVYLTDAPSKNACHSEEGRKPRRGNPHRHSGNLEGIATPVCGLVRNDTEFCSQVRRFIQNDKLQFVLTYRYMRIIAKNDNHVNGLCYCHSKKTWYDERRKTEKGVVRHEAVGDRVWPV